MAVDELLKNDRFVSTLRSAVDSGEGGLKNVPGLLRQVLREDMWRERTIRQTGEIVQFERFADFVESEPLEGLGADIKILERLCADDPETLRLLRRATVEKRGAPMGNQNASHNGTNSDNVTVCSEPERGNSRAYTLDRLSRERPDLYEQVEAKEMTANAAAIEAGFRPRTISVPLTVDGVFRAAFKLSPAERVDLTTLLMKAD